MSDICSTPWCNELIAMLKHNEVRIRANIVDFRVVSYHVDLVNNGEFSDIEPDIVKRRSTCGEFCSGDGCTLKEALDEAILSYCGYK